MLFRRSVSAIVLSQAAMDLGTCALAATLGAILAPVPARRRVAMAALWFAALCPFLANYSAAVLTEALATSLTTAALVFYAAGLGSDSNEAEAASIFLWGVAPLSASILGALLTGLATLVRPEMPLLLVVALPVYFLRWRKPLGFRKVVLACAAMGCASLLPLSPWAVRNWITLHEVQILAPRYVTMPGEIAPVGFYAWTGTWLERYRDVYLTVWQIGEDRMDIEDLPGQAFDSPQEKAKIADLLNQYNSSDALDVSPDMDSEFAEIARERTRRHPLRTYVEVPFQRALSIWFTPRTEPFPIDGKLWPLRDQWRDSPADVLTTAGFAALGYIYVAMAMGGIWVAWRGQRTRFGESDAESSSNLWGVALLVAYLLGRTAFLTTVEAPEPRYVVTCYPAVLALAALVWSRAGSASPKAGPPKA